MRQASYDNLQVKIYESRMEMGKGAAGEAALCLKRLLEEKEEINCMFAAAPSQNEFLERLIGEQDIDWSRINAFHMDEYCGLPQRGKGTFSGFLCNAIFDRVPFRSVNLLNGGADPGEESERYGRLLREKPLDVVFMGIGENGHIAFNDPPVADFLDGKMVKRVKLDHMCRQQQVNDGCFPSLEEVPAYALTVTVPGLMSAEHVFCMVPGGRKAQAVKDALEGPVAESCPASILRRHSRAGLYLDCDAAKLL